MRKLPKLYPAARVVCLAFLKLFFPYEVTNGKSLPEDKGMIVCSNHIHAIDPVLINATQNRLLFFMAKKELFKFKPIGHLIKKYGAFPVNRGNDGGNAIHTGEELLHDDNVVGIFIEGTRSRSGKFGNPHTGAIVMAHHTNTPILPCCITGKETFVKPFKKTKITYGTPVTCEELGIKEGTNLEYRKAAAKVMEMISGLREQQRKEFGSKE